MNDLERLRAALEDPAPLTWVVTGDSITHGLVHTRAGRSYPEHLHEAIRGDMGRVDDVIINTAVSGWRTRQLLETFDRRVAQWRPSVVLLMTGSNDCSTGPDRTTLQPDEFAAQVREFLERTRALGALCLLQTPPHLDMQNCPERSRLPAFAEAMRQVAASTKTILVDQYAAFEEAARQHAFGIRSLLNDPLHPNGAGHAILAKTLFGAMRITDLAPETSRLVAAEASRR